MRLCPATGADRCNLSVHRGQRKGFAQMAFANLQSQITMVHLTSQKDNGSVETFQCTVSPENPVVRPLRMFIRPRIDFTQQFYLCPSEGGTFKQTFH